MFAEESGLAFVPTDPVDFDWRRVHGHRGTASWAGLNCRFEFAVGVELPPGGPPLRLVEHSEVERVQERSSIRVATRLAVEVLLNSAAAVTRLHGETANLSATGAAIALDRRAVKQLGHVASTGDLVALSVELPDHRVPVLGEVVAMVTQGRTPIMRVRFHSARTADVDRIAGFVLRTHARRA